MFLLSPFYFHSSSESIEVIRTAKSFCQYDANILQIYDANKFAQYDAQFMAEFVVDNTLYCCKMKTA